MLTRMMWVCGARVGTPKIMADGVVTFRSVTATSASVDLPNVDWARGSTEWLEVCASNGRTNSMTTMAVALLNPATSDVMGTVCGLRFRIFPLLPLPSSQRRLAMIMKQPAVASVLT
jgi:hypothetical protein